MKTLFILYLKSKMEVAKVPASLGWQLGLISDGLMEVAARWAMGSLHQLGQLESEGR